MGSVNDTGKNMIRGNEAGYILIMALFVLLIVSLVAMTLAVVGMNEFKITARARMMDQAYAIAEAGINRALIECRDNPDLTEVVGSVYPNPTPQWGPHAEDFGGGRFEVSLWQSNLETDNPNYKVIRSKGTIEKAGKSAERAIETRVIVGAGSRDYDASFDYCIYNGMKDPDEGNPDGDSDPAGTWPNVTYWFGNFTIDGASPYPPPPAPDPHYPKGAVYTRGTVNLPTRLAGAARIKGNLVATDDIYLSNAFEATAFREALTIDDGNVIAGLDGTGNAYVDTVGTAALGQEPIQLSGYLCAANNVRVRSMVSLNLGGRPISLRGIISGGNVEVTGVAGLSVNAALELGNVFSEGRTSIWSGFGVNTRFDLLNTGRGAGGQGADLQTYFLGPIGTVSRPCGAVYSQGRVDLRTAIASMINLGDVYAGTDSGAAPNYYGGNGVDVRVLLANVTTGSITSRGKVQITVNNAVTALNCGGSRITAGSDGTGVDGTGTGVDINMVSLGYTNFANGIRSAGRVNVTGGSLTTTLGEVVAGKDGGNVGINVNTGGVAVTVKNLTATGSILINAYGIGSGVGALTSGGSIVANVGGAGFDVGRVTARDNIQVGAGGVVGGIGPMKAGGNIELGLTAIGALTIGSIEAGGNILLNTAIAGVTDIDRIVANGNLNANFDSAVIAGVSIKNGIAVGGNVATRVSMYVLGASSLTINDLGWWTGTVPEGCDKNTDALWSGGNTSMEARIYGLGLAWTTVVDNARAGGNCSSSGIFNGNKYSGVGGLSGWTPGVDVPGQPVMPQRPSMPSCPPVNVPVYPVQPGGGSVTLQGTPVDVNRALLCELAGLERPVNLLKPNWSYFEQQAMQDEMKTCPACNKANARGTQFCQFCGADIRGVPDPPPHVLEDGGPGDSDGARNGRITFLWDNSKPYSSNETIYSGDPTVPVWLNYNWDNPGWTNFRGTLVARGDILIDSSLVAPRASTGQVLNLVSGHDIKRRQSGIVLWQQTDVEYHFWALDDIDMRDLQFSFYGNKRFYGSFTAGDRFYYASSTIWDNTTFKWSRWSLDPQAWIPPFEVLSWREV